MAKHRLNKTKSRLISITIVVISFTSILLSGIAYAYIWPKYDGTLRAPIADSRLELDPAAEMTYDELGIFFALYDCLFLIDDSGNVQSNLVESYQTSDNLTKYAFKLWSYVKFSDGTQMGASDVVASIQSTLLRIGDRADAFENIAQIKALDSLTVEFQLKIADPDLPRKLAHPVCAIYKGNGNEVRAGSTYLFHFIGTGPFVLDDVTSKRIRLIRNENYHRGKAYLKAIDFEISPIEDESFLRFTSGKLDFHRVPYTQYRELMRRQGVNLSNRKGADTIILDLAYQSQARPYISNVKPDELVNVIMNHAGTGATGILPDDELKFPFIRSRKQPSQKPSQVVIGYFGDKNLLEPVARRIATEWQDKGLNVSVIQIDSYPSGLCDAVVRIVKTMGQDSDFIWRSVRTSLGATKKMPLTTEIFTIPEKAEEQEFLDKGNFLPLARPQVAYALSDKIRNFRLIAGCVPDYWSISID